MAAIYARWIKAGKLTLDEVPKKWLSQVEMLLKGGD
jgi:hypothetical protein